MIHRSNISIVSVMCALCVYASGVAYGAPSVRALGGTGTISGTSAASNAASGNTTSTGVARAGSVRVTPTSGKAATSTSVSSGNTTAARGATTSRLSIGKYLGSAVTSSGNKLTPNVSVTSSGNTNISNDVTTIVNELKGLQKQVDDLQDQVDNFVGPNDAYTRAEADGKFISNDNLGEHLGSLAFFDEVEEEHLSQKLQDKINNIQVEIEDGSIGENMLNTALQEKINSKVADVDLSGKQDKLDDQQMASVNSGITAESVKKITDAITANETAIETKANASDVYTTDEIDNKLADIESKIPQTGGGDGIGHVEPTGNFVWVSLDGEQKWLPIADGQSQQ